jgi:hypothetical protein
VVVKHSLLVVFLALGCIGEPATEDDERESVQVTGALDNQVDPDEGKACYQDVPMRKGKMEMGMCCFDDPDKGTSECVACDKDHHCTIGGAEPGALTTGLRGFVWDRRGAVLDVGSSTSGATATKAASLGQTLAQ